MSGSSKQINVSSLTADSPASSLAFSAIGERPVPARSLPLEAPGTGSVGAADCSLTCGSQPANAADDEREWRAQQQHERAENKEAFAHTPAIGNPAHQRRDHDRGKPLAGLTQAHDRALLVAADCSRLHRQDDGLDQPFQPAAYDPE